jgi:hypothetical protein
MLVVPELETELNILQRHACDMAELKALRTVRGGLEDQIDRLEWYLNHGAGAPPSIPGEAYLPLGHPTILDMNIIVLWPVWPPRTIKCNNNNNNDDNLIGTGFQQLCCICSMGLMGTATMGRALQLMTAWPPFAGESCDPCACAG